MNGFCPWGVGPMTGCGSGQVSQTQAEERAAGLPRPQYHFLWNWWCLSGGAMSLRDWARLLEAASEILPFRVVSGHFPFWSFLLPY